MTGPHFPEWVRNSVHECAPDHSTQLVEVGRLREASRTIGELYEALEICRAALDPYIVHNVGAGTAREMADAALAKARGDVVA